MADPTTPSHGGQPADPSTAKDAATDCALCHRDAELFLHSVVRELKCPVCLDTAQDPVVPPCSHVHCRECMARSLDLNGGVCTVCKQRADQRTLVDVPLLGQLIAVAEAIAADLGVEDPTEMSQGGLFGDNNYLETHTSDSDENRAPVFDTRGRVRNSRGGRSSGRRSDAATPQPETARTPHSTAQRSKAPEESLSAKYAGHSHRDSPSSPVASGSLFNPTALFRDLSSSSAVFKKSSSALAVPATIHSDSVTDQAMADSVVTPTIENTTVPPLPPQPPPPALPAAAVEEDEMPLFQGAPARVPPVGLPLRPPMATQVLGDSQLFGFGQRAEGAPGLAPSVLFPAALPEVRPPPVTSAATQRLSPSVAQRLQAAQAEEHAEHTEGDEAAGDAQEPGNDDDGVPGETDATPYLPPPVGDEDSSATASVSPARASSNAPLHFEPPPLFMDSENSRTMPPAPSDAILLSSRAVIGDGPATPAVAPPVVTPPRSTPRVTVELSPDDSCGLLLASGRQRGASTDRRASPLQEQSPAKPTRAMTAAAQLRPRSFFADEGSMSTVDEASLAGPPPGPAPLTDPLTGHPSGSFGDGLASFNVHPASGTSTAAGTLKPQPLPESTEIGLALDGAFPLLTARLPHQALAADSGNGGTAVAADPSFSSLNPFAAGLSPTKTRSAFPSPLKDPAPQAAGDGPTQVCETASLGFSVPSAAAFSSWRGVGTDYRGTEPKRGPDADPVPGPAAATQRLASPTANGGLERQLFASSSYLGSSSRLGGTTSSSAIGSKPAVADGDASLCGASTVTALATAEETVVGDTTSNGQRLAGSDSTPSPSRVRTTKRARSPPTPPSFAAPIAHSAEGVVGETAACTTSTADEPLSLIQASQRSSVVRAFTDSIPALRPPTGVDAAQLQSGPRSVDSLRGPSSGSMSVPLRHEETAFYAPAAMDLSQRGRAPPPPPPPADDTDGYDAEAELLPRPVRQATLRVTPDESLCIVSEPAFPLDQAQLSQAALGQQGTSSVAMVCSQPMVECAMKAVADRVVRAVSVSTLTSVSSTSVSSVASSSHHSEADGAVPGVPADATCFLCQLDTRDPAAVRARLKAIIRADPTCDRALLSTLTEAKLCSMLGPLHTVSSARWTRYVHQACLLWCPEVCYDTDTSSDSSEAPCHGRGGRGAGGGRGRGRGRGRGAPPRKRGRPSRSDSLAPDTEPSSRSSSTDTAEDLPDPEDNSEYRQLFNGSPALRRVRHQFRCCVCGEGGAGRGCDVPRCRVSAHWLCARLAGPAVLCSHSTGFCCPKHAVKLEV